LFEAPRRLEPPQGDRLLEQVKRLGRPRRPRRALRLDGLEIPADDDARARYFLPDGYTSRESLRYYHDQPPAGVTYQPGVYRATRSIARRLGASSVVDIGCGRAGKLVAFHPEFAIVGIDLGPNLEYCRRHFDFGTWVEHDLDSPGPLPLAEQALEGSAIVCADVVEHMTRPDRLLTKLGAALGAAKAVVISTPDRERMHTAPMGPPANISHVREWSQDEFGALLKSQGFDNGRVTHTRPHTGTLARTTLLAICVPSRGESGA
jgi:SAM-dependent methyltransferase